MLMTVLMLMSVAWIPLIHLPEKDNILEETVEEQPTITTTQNFATNNGFTHTNLTQDSVTGLTVLERPPISWTTPSGFGLTSLRTGACSAYLPSTNEVYLIGGRVDVDPSQTGDEASTTLVEVFDMVNKTWSPSTSILPEVQQYHNCAVAGGKIYAIGDHYPFASPSVEATGLVQVFDPTTGNWTDGTSMPGNQSVGLAGTASQDGMIYVAGGVSAHDRSDSTDRLLRYDPINDTWTQLASMNNERHSFQLVSYKGKLIAFGGVAIYFDPIANTTVEGETNLTEAYDPVTNTWSQLPNASHRFSAYAAAVFNDEIIIHGGYELSGWQGTASDKTYGYNPFTNQWNTYATLQVGMYDSTLVLANDTLVYAGGDASNTRFSTWSMQYLAENEYHTNPSSHHGLLTSSIQDLRANPNGAASLLWLDYSAIEPNGTFIGLQYRTASSLQGIASASWLPTTLPVNTYVSPGNTSLGGTIEDAPYLQYRVKFATDRLMEWAIPTLVEVNIGADTAGFAAPLPTAMQPTSAPITVTTQHHNPTAEGTYVLAIHPADSQGSLDANSNWMRLVWNTTNEQLTIDDPDGLLFNQQASVLTGPMTSAGQAVNWSFSLGGTIPTDYLTVKTSTHAQRNTTFIHPDIVTVDRDVTVEIAELTADFSSEGDDSVEFGEVLPGNTLLNVTIDHMFTNSGLRLLGGSIEARIHMDLETFDLDSQGERIWANESSEWFDLPAGQRYHALVNAPEALSGEMHLWFEARTSEEWNLDVASEPMEFVINGEGPTLLSQTPTTDAYINEDVYQSVSFLFHDVGGFSNETLAAYSWIEARDDGTNGQPADGIAQREEYQPVVFYLHNEQNRWFVNVTVNDTINENLQSARVLLEGTDHAGFPVPSTTADEAHVSWVSRTPSKGDLLVFEPTKNLLSSTLMRFEPSQEVGWHLQVSDANGLSDISEVRIELGNDDLLGLRYTTADDTCDTLDERLVLTENGCIVSINNGVMDITMTAIVQWSFTLGGIVQGEVDVYIRDYDGTQHFDSTDAWVLERELTIEVNQLTDLDGLVQQPIEEGAILMAGDKLHLVADITHRTSDTPYTGMLQLHWDGLLQEETWRGSTPVTIVDGVMEYSIPTPDQSGLVQSLQLSLWDPLETEMLSELEVDSFHLDHQAPEIMPSAIDGTISRYHLEAVEVGVNIKEEKGWSAPLTLTCQVRSLDITWDAVTLVRNFTTVFDGKTMFSFMFDFSEMGDPSTLSQQANLACWAEGLDDAGWALISSVGNTELDPWLDTPLNNIGPDLGLEKVEISGEVNAGEKVRLSFNVINGGESITTPFNATIEVVQGDERTLVGRSIFSSMDENTAKSVKRSFEAPEGAWTLEITVDLEQLIWEIDETNNVHVQDFNSDGGGLGALTVMVGGGGLLTLLGVGVLLRRRGGAGVDEAKIVAAIEATEKPPVPKPPATPPEKKRRGPPGGKIASGSSTRPARGPPRKQAPQESASPQATAAKYFDALGGVDEPSTDGEEETTVSDYSKLPGGGEYEYTADATYYVGETCGRWRLNEDKSFTKIIDE